MPQWRKLHVKTIDSVDINDMPDDFHRLTWLMLPLILDSAGRAIDNSAWLRSKLYPMRQDVTPAQVDAVLDWCAERGMVDRYQVGTRKFFQVPTFEKYQGKTDREAVSVIPEKPKKPLKNKPVQVKTNSGPTQDLGPDWSGLDVDVDAEETRGDATSGAHAPVAEVDPVKELAVVFEQAAGIKLPEVKSEKGKAQVGILWWNPLKEMVKMANGRATDVMRLSVQRMRKEKLTIAAPNSVLKVFTSLYGESVTSAPAPLSKHSADEIAANRAALAAVGIGKGASHGNP